MPLAVSGWYNGFMLPKRFLLLPQAKGFTLIELLIVIALVGILAAVVVMAINPGKRFDELYLAKSKEQLGVLVRATEAHALTQGDYPADVDRNIPTALLDDLRGSNWPTAPWPGSVFDWDNIDLGGGASYQQYSIRFCSITGDNCQYPKYFEWASGFDYQSAVYWCMAGPCRPHRDRPQSHPGFCVNCPPGRPDLSS